MSIHFTDVFEPVLMSARPATPPDGATFYANLFCHIMQSMSSIDNSECCCFPHFLGHSIDFIQYSCTWNVATQIWDLQDWSSVMISFPKQVWSKMLSSKCAHVEVFATFLGRKLYFGFSMPATNGMRTNFPAFSRHFLIGRSKHLSINGSVHMWVKLFWPIIKDDPIQQV